MVRTDSGKNGPATAVAGILLLLVIAGGAFILFGPRRDPPTSSQSRDLRATQRKVSVGGVERSEASVFKPLQTADSPRLLESEFSSVQPVLPSSSPAAKSLYDAIESSENPEFSSPAFSPPPFDLQKYQKDPDAYLDLHVPGRMWQTAQPGEGVPVLVSKSKRRLTLRKGESVRLSVETKPNMPATFTSVDLGTFDNGLNTISVQADENGVATAAFTASGGVGNMIHVVAASPVATERVQFQVFVVSNASIDTDGIEQ